MKCPKCNTKNVEGAIFCKGCGLDLREAQAKAKDNKNIKSDISYREINEIEEALYEISVNLEKLYDNWNTFRNGTEGISNEEYKKQIITLQKENEGYKQLIEVQKKQLIEMKKQLGNVYVCPKCNKKYHEKVMFCSGCGTKMSEK